MRTLPFSLILAIGGLLNLSPITSAQTVLLPAGSTWKYLDDGSDQGTAWRGPSFNDQTWKSGPAQLGYGDGDEATAVGFGPDSSAKYITTYFRHAFDVADPTALGTLNLGVQRDDGVVVYLNGTEVFRDNMPSGAVGYRTTASVALGGTDETTFAPATISPASLVPGQNVLAVEIHQANGTSSDISFDLELLANLAPSVTLTAPADNQSITGPTDVTVSATATDSDGTVVKVEFFQNGLRIGEDSAAPFSLVWTNVLEGNYVLTAVATDDQQGSRTSEPVHLTVNDPNPPGLLSAAGTTNSVTVRFSKPVSPATATNTAHYSLPGISILSAAFGLDSNTVVLGTSPMVSGQTYDLSVTGVEDRLGQAIAPNASIQFLVQEYLPRAVGDPVVAGGSVAAGGGYDVSGAGSGIDGSTDQFAFTSKELNGDFDVQVRVESFDLSDPWAQAGLMARENLEANSRFAAALATPAMSGSYFASRVTVGGMVSRSGNFPVNYPQTWLRLQRAGNAFTGYAGYDGQHWQRLGTATLNLPSTIYLGLAVSSLQPAELATAEFREFLPANSPVVGGTRLSVEPPGPSSRKTGLAITEIMYEPAPRDDGRQLQFVELYNSNPFREDISGYRLSGDIDYTFPTGTVLPGGGYLVVAKAPADLQAVYGLDHVLGPFMGSLPRSGTVRLRNRQDAIYLEVPYSNKNPWPVAADGTGHSLVLARPSFGEGFAEAWAISDAAGGSPGGMDGAGSSPLRAVVINEFLAHSTMPLLDFIELYNHSNQDVDVSGCTLSDDPQADTFVIPAGTVIPARGFLVFQQDQLGFGVSAGGETLYFKNANRTRVLDAVQFEAQADGVSSGRFPDGAPSFYPLTARTPGAANSGIRISDIAINELMYDPISGDPDDQYVELYNHGTNTVDLGGWRFTEGIRYEFPPQTLLAPGGYLVVAGNAAHLIPNYPQLSSTNTLGDFGGRLSGKGERVALGRPDISYSTNDLHEVQTNTVYVVVDEVTYGTGGRWPHWANGGGSSMELIDARADHRLPSNWADSDETSKSSWTTIVGTGVLDNGQGYNSGPIDNLQVVMLGEGECLLDDVEVIGSGGRNLLANPGFESGMVNWTPQGDHIATTLDSTEGYNSVHSLHVRASARGDTGPNRIRSPLTSNMSPGETGLIRAKVRWLRGWPEMVLRVHGNWLEATGRLNVPANLGTPGLPNSTAVDNAPPAIFDVIHHPILPAASEPVVVTARVHDPDGLGWVMLHYRIDPSTTDNVVAMRDDGTGGDEVASDGLYSATIPGQAAGVLVAFHVDSIDASSAPASGRFPSDAPTQECLVRFGDPAPASSFGVYRLWLTQAAVNTWINRPVLSNERIDGTFVCGNYRVIYNMGTKYAGSPYHQGFSSPVTSACHYSMEMPKDDLFLGTDNFNKIHAPGNGPFDDDTIQREQTSYWMARQIGLPWNYRRYVAFYCNGNRKGSLMEDTQTPGADVIDEWFPNDADGNLYKLQPWFEFDDGNTGSVNFSNNSWCTLNDYTNTGGMKKLARYRWNYLTRAAHNTANDYTNVFELIDAANSFNSAPYTANLEAIADMEEWLRIFAVEHAVGNWDSFGNRNSQNMYGYKPEAGKWTLFIWDYNIVLGNSGSDGPGALLFQYQTADLAMPHIYNNPPWRRAYWRALKEIASGPMDSAKVDPLMDAKYEAFVANGLSGSVNSPQAVKAWIASARSSILSQVAAVDAAAFTVDGPASFTTNRNVVTLTGAAPVEIKTIKVNGVEWPVSWPDVADWRILLPIQSGTNTLQVQGFDVYGQPVAGAGTSLNVVYAGQAADPQGTVVINEIMANPVTPGAQYVEIFNTSQDFSFDLAHWSVNGLSYTFPQGSILAPGEYLLLVKNRAAFSAAYGAGLPVFAEFPGTLQPDGETLSLIKPGPTAAEDVIVDQVKYSAAAPWPAPSASENVALQLIDPARDNARVSNWGTSAEWLHTTVTGAATTSRLYLYLNGTGDIYIDDIQLVAGSVAEMGPNLIQNGGFESPLDPAWPLPPQNAASAISSTTVHSGSGALHLVSTNTVVSLNTIFIQNITPALTSGETYTLSYWYRPNPATTNDLVLRLASSLLNSTHDVFPVTFTPGAPNSVQGALPAYPPLWINEVLPENLDSLQDNAGQRDPWIELYNSGSAPIALDGLFLTDNYSNLTAWPFPAGASIAPSQFLLVWADGQPAQSTSTELHTSFRLNPGSGSLALAGPNGNQPLILDYINYQNLTPGRSYGSFPDGQLFKRQVFAQLTPGAPNNGSGPAAVQVFINEWMAANTATLADPADGAFDDWLELYNAGDSAVDLSNWFLTDDLGAPELWRIPTGASIAPHGFLLVWADNQPEQNGFNNPLHAGFQLAREGESIGLADPDGLLVDSVSFGAQTNDVSQGRFPDGAPGPYVQMNAPTPGAPNITSEGGLLRLGGVTRVSATELSFTVGTEAGRAYRVEYKNNLEDPVWTPLGLDHVATGNTLSLTVPMDAGPQRFYRIVQLD